MTAITDVIRLYPADGQATGALILAHGAGAGQSHPFITGYARALAGRGIDVVTFDFPYMRARRKVPDPAPVLERCYLDIVAHAQDHVPAAARALFIGGKSMGGRIATHIAAADPELPLAGLVLLGYPLHPPGRPDRRRDAHLPQVRRPVLFVQGTRDTFGTPDELRPVLATMAPEPTLHVVAGGDHSFKTSGGRDSAEGPATGTVVQAIADWIRQIAS